LLSCLSNKQLQHFAITMQLPAQDGVNTKYEWGTGSGL
jgi:hypothetical protein